MSKDEKLNNGIKLRGKTYSYVLRVPDPTTGKTKPKWVGGFLTVKEAKAARDKARVLLSTRDYIAPTKITLGEFLDRWIEIHARNLRLTSSESYRLSIRRIKAVIGDVKLQDVKPSHIEKLYAALQSEGDRPNNRLQQLTGKNQRTVQGYFTEARKRNLLLKAKPGKVSPVRKVRKAGKK